MTLELPDDVFRRAGLSENEARIEIACRLFQAGKLTLGEAVRLAGVPRTEFEDECLKRKIAVYEVTAESFAEDLQTIEHLKRTNGRG